MSNQLECPVDFVVVNENKVRLVVLWVLVLGIAFLFVQHWTIPAFLMIDFYLRGFHNGKFSLLNQLADLVESKLKIPNKPIDRAPKRFAAQIGFLMTDMILIVSFLGLDDAAIYMDAVLILFAFLESAFSICAGCHVYTFFKKIGINK